MTARLLDSRKQKAAWGLLAVAVLFVFLFELGGYRSLGTHEVVAAVPGREMWQSGDWVVPRYAEVPRLKKPPMVYWSVAVSSWLCGETSEFASRLHSALAAMGLVVVMSLWAHRWYGRDAAFAAGVIQTFSVWAIKFGRRAEIDMVLCLLTTTAFFLIATQPEAEAASSRRLRWIGILSLLGVSWLAKFHFGTAMVLGPTFVFWIVQRQWRRFFDVLNPIGLAVALTCVAVWPWLLLERFPNALEVWRRETVGRATGELGSDPWWLYPKNLLFLTLPWTLHLAAAVVPSWHAAWSRGEARERFLWIWLAVDLVLMSMSPNRHHNYLAALLPAMTLLAAQSAARLRVRLRDPDFRVPQVVPIVSSLLSAALAGTLVWFVATRFPTVLESAQIAGLFLVVASGLIGWQVYRRRWSLAGWTTIWASVGLFCIAVAGAIPRGDHRRPMVEFARRVRREILHDQPVSVFVPSGVLTNQHPVVFYLDSPVRRVLSLTELQAGLSEHGMLLAVTEQRFVPEISRFATVRKLDELSDVTDQEVPLVCLELKSSEPDNVGPRTMTHVRRPTSSGSLEKY